MWGGGGGGVVVVGGRGVEWEELSLGVLRSKGDLIAVPLTARLSLER